MDILNFISWIKKGRYSSTMPTNAVTVVGVPNPNRDDKYLPVTVPVSSFGGKSNIGKLLGGGIVVAEWDDNGVHKALIASLTNVGLGLPWTVPAQQTNLIGAAAQNPSIGLGNTDAIIAQTGLPATIFYAAGIARLYLGGGYNDWYLPATWELNICYVVANIVNKVLGPANGFIAGAAYWSSTEQANNTAYGHSISATSVMTKVGSYNIRAVRIHTL